jgi:hypothetical protein
VAGIGVDAPVGQPATRQSFDRVTGLPKHRGPALNSPNDIGPNPAPPQGSWPDRQHDGGIEKFSIGTVNTPSVKRNYYLRSHTNKAGVHFERYCGRGGFGDSVWAMIMTSTVKMIIGGGGGGRCGGGGGRCGGGGGR